MSFWNFIYDGISHENVLSLILCFRDVAVATCFSLVDICSFVVVDKDMFFPLVIWHLNVKKSNYQDAMILLLAFSPQTYLNKICMMKKKSRKKNCIAKLWPILIKCHQLNRILNSFYQTLGR